MHEIGIKWPKNRPYILTKALQLGRESNHHSKTLKKCKLKNNILTKIKICTKKYYPWSILKN
jgi:hypothetical protein